MEANGLAVLAIAMPVLLIMLPIAWGLIKALRLEGPSFLSFSALALSLAMIGASSYSLYRYSGEYLPLASAESKHPGLVGVRQAAAAYTQGGSLNVRAEPSLEGEVLFQLANGTRVDCQECCCKDVVNGKNGKWCKVKTADGQTGWCWGWNLQLLE